MKKKISEDKYTGESQSGKRHGTGRCEYGNGEVYEGEWKNGKRDGFGIFIGTDGCRYMGQFKNDNYHGYGTMYASDEKRPDATVISGQWVNGDADGIGVVFGGDGKVYAGQISKTRLSGIGLKISEEGISAGQTAVDQGYSLSLLFRNDGTTGLSRRKDGKLHGKQMNYCADGSRQVTKFDNGNKDIISYIEMSDGTMIIGEMDDQGVLDGEVSLIYPDGRKFKRSFTKGKELSDWQPAEY